jgi:hypothetical protein
MSEAVHIEVKKVHPKSQFFSISWRTIEKPVDKTAKSEALSAMMPD